MAEPTTPPDVGQQAQAREWYVRQLIGHARTLLDEAARLLDLDPHPTKED